MLFLLNDQIAEVDIPEMHLVRRWKSLGCGDPYGMRARDALDFASKVVGDHLRAGVRLEESLLQDIGALIIAKTGANAALFPVVGGNVGEPRLTILPETIIGSLKEKIAHEGKLPDMREIWPAAA